MSKEPDHNPRKALGKGLSALLPTRPLAVMPKAAPTPEPPRGEPSEDLQNIPVDQIRPNEDQPRESFDADKLKELAQSIAENGLIQPITVCRDGDVYRIIAGERRWRAARIAGLKELPALVRSAEAHQFLELALVENIQREDLNPIEIAIAFERLATQHGLSHEQIALRTGKDRSTVTNFLRLLKLPPPLREQVVKGNLSMGHARALLNIADAELQQKIAGDIVGKQLSVRETEHLVNQLTYRVPKVSERINVPMPNEDPNVVAALNEMAMALGTKVKLVRKSDTAGRIEIEYYSQDDLDRIYSVIVKQ